MSSPTYDPDPSGSAAERRALTVDDVVAMKEQIRRGNRDLSDDERIHMLRALTELTCAAEAGMADIAVDFDESMRARAAANHVPSERQGRGVAAQIAFARRESLARGERFLQLAKTVREMPCTNAAWRDGLVPRWTVTELVKGTACLSREDRAAVDLEVAGDPDRLEQMSPRQAGAAASAAAYQADPMSFVARRRKAEADRHTSIRPAPDVMRAEAHRRDHHPDRSCLRDRRAPTGPRTGALTGGDPSSGALLGRIAVGPIRQPVTVHRIALSRLPADRVRASDADGEQELELAELPSYVAGREPERPRWVWDDTARWYPLLLAAGVRVERCHDLRLCHHLLRSAPAVDRALLSGDQSAEWDRLGPSAALEPALFLADETSEYLRADDEDARQLAAVAASPEAGKLELLLVAESSGALVAAEMTFAGMPWRADVHERLLEELVGPRPPRGGRPALLDAQLEVVREALDAPTLNPESRPELIAALHRLGMDVDDTRASTLRRLEHPGIEPLLRYKQQSQLLSTNGWAWLDEWVSDGRFRPSYQPAGSVTGRWSSNGGGAQSLPIQVRPAAVADDGWALVVADVAQLEPRVLAGMSGDRALLRSARGADLYQGMVDDGAVQTRQHAKLGLLGAMYGATTGESGRILADLVKRYPHAFGLVEDAARAGERGEVVRTLLGRGSPSIGDFWDQDPEEHVADPDRLTQRRRAFGRFTRNFVVQGTGAEWALCWIADLRNRLWRLGATGALDERPHLVFFLHDEVVVHTPTEHAEAVAAELVEAAATAARLVFRGLDIDFPLNINDVTTYAEAGKPGSA